ncbi:MAG: VOC family protein [Acidobacteria bacterium]|nr:VOC family protein [Acidobacteriota bacterium]MBS1864335.1 VOC family protein [Acidobacteriota bacterium]
MNTRREFLGWMAAAVLTWGSKSAGKSGYATGGGASVRSRWFEMGADMVPKVLDHILLGCADLESGISFVEARTGVKAAFGGVHPGRGTQNALLSLGERRYLEIIAPDPKQAAMMGPESSVERLKLRELREPRLVTWAAHPGRVDLLAVKLERAGMAASGPTPGSRKRPDGKLLQWKTLNLKDDAEGLLPFFIEWSADSVHPSVDAPKGCELKKFWVESPKAEDLRKQVGLMEIDVEVKHGESARLRARIDGPKGDMELSG